MENPTANPTIKATISRIYRDEVFNTKSDGSGKPCHLGNVTFKGKQLSVQIPTKVEADAPLSVGDEVSVAYREYNGNMYFTVIGRPITNEPITVDDFKSLLGEDAAVEVTKEVLEA